MTDTKESGRMIKYMEMAILLNILGIYYFDNGSKYEGEFKNGKFDGKGK